jgi:AhpD family alkylhydroperoxidase
MGEMKDNLKEVNASLGRFSKDYPEQMKGFGGLMQAVEAPGALDSKQKELIAIALSINAHCHWCIAYHVNGALEKGATKEEIIEASWVAVVMGGGPSLMYMQLVEKAIKDFKKKK